MEDMCANKALIDAVNDDIRLSCRKLFEYEVIRNTNNALFNA